MPSKAIPNQESSGNSTFLLSWAPRTVMCCNNQSAINMVNARVPTERSRHIDIQHFAIRD